MEFYPTMVKWWEGHNFPPLPVVFLPEKVFIFNNGKEDTYCCTMYKTDSLLAWVAWQISNPDVKSNSNELKEIFITITNYAKELGYKLLFTTTKHETVIDKLLETDFNIGDNNVNHYLKSI